MKPTGFNRIEPGGFLWKQPDNQSHTTCCFGLLIMGTYPTFDPFTFVPTGMVPNNNGNLLLGGGGCSNYLGQKSQREITIRLTWTKSQDHLVCPMPHSPIASQCLGWFFLRYGPFNQVKTTPVMGVGLGKATEPTFILPPQSHVCGLFRPANQGLTAFFLTS